MSTIRVVIADDDDEVRDALGEVLGADARFAVVGTARTGDEAVSLASVCEPDVVLLDVRMPGGGPEAARRLTTGPGSLPAVVAVSADTGVASIVAMVRAGAVGYLTKGRLGDLNDLVARCATGQVVLAAPGAADAMRQLLADAPGGDRTDVG